MKVSSASRAMTASVNEIRLYNSSSDWIKLKFSIKMHYLNVYLRFFISNDILEGFFCP